MDRLLISIMIVIMIFEENGIIIKSEILNNGNNNNHHNHHNHNHHHHQHHHNHHHHNHNSDSNIYNLPTSSSQLNHHIRHQSHHYIQNNGNKLIQNLWSNNANLKHNDNNNNNNNNNNNDMIINHNNNEELNDDQESYQYQHHQYNEHHDDPYRHQILTNINDNNYNGNNFNPNSMEFIGFGDDSMYNLNSEYSVNTDSKEYDINKQTNVYMNLNKKNHNNNNYMNNINNNEISHRINNNKNNEDIINNENDRNSNGDISANNNNNNNNKVNNKKDENSNSIKCPKCSTQTQNVRVSEEELIELRIEFVKNQILQKLRLKEKPKVYGGVNVLPKLIYDGTQIGLQNDENKSLKDLDDYYARTSQKFIFLEQEQKECYRTNPQHPSMCFSFKIDGDVDNMDVNTAELWVFKKNNRRDRMKQTFVVSEVYQGMNSKYLPKAKPIAIQSTGVEEGWIKFDIAWPIRKWFGNHDLNHIIEISCQSCELDTTSSSGINSDNDNNNNYYYYGNYNLISVEKDYTPFIVIDTMNRRQRRRQKRSVNCTAGVTECCREKLYISFEEIGWDDWIIQPSGYNAYFCRGSCSSAASITISNTHHGSFLRKVLYQRESSGKKPLELIPCCTAKQFSSLQLLYRDSNNTATLKTLPNMVVESCGCM